MSRMLELLVFLIENTQCNVNFQDEYGNTALHWACDRGFLNGVKFLVENCYANVNLKNNIGETPLHWACKWMWMDIVKYLIENAHADVHTKDIYGDSLIEWARRCRYFFIDDLEDYLKSQNIFTEKN
jgi:ankyrin repeat protein